MRRLKQLVDKATIEATNAENELPKLKPKGYPKEMTKFFQSAISTFRECINGASVFYDNEVTKVDSALQTDAEVLSQSTKSTDTHLHELDAKFKAFKENVASDIKKLTG